MPQGEIHISDNVVDSPEFKVFAAKFGFNIPHGWSKIVIVFEEGSLVSSTVESRWVE